MDSHMKLAAEAKEKGLEAPEMVGLEKSGIAGTEKETEEKDEEKEKKDDKDGEEKMETDDTEVKKEDEEEARAELFQRVSGEMSDHALICCAVRSRRGEVAEQRTELGLVKNHAYGVTGVRRVNIGSGINAVLKR